MVSPKSFFEYDSPWAAQNDPAETRQPDQGEMVREALEQPEAFLDDNEKKWLIPLNRVQRGLAGAGYCLNRLLVHAFFKVKAVGLQNLPAKSPFLITPNHTSVLDVPVLASVLEEGLWRETYWAGLREKAFRTFPQRWICRLAQVVPIARSKGAASSLAFASAVLQRRKNLIWFPEGKRSITGKLQPLKAGIGLLLESYPVPVVPVYIHGTFGALPTGQLCPRPDDITIVFGAPADRQTLEAEGEGEDSVERTADGLHNRIAMLRSWLPRESVPAGRRKRQTSPSPLPVFSVKHPQTGSSAEMR